MQRPVCAAAQLNAAADPGKREHSDQPAHKASTGSECGREAIALFDKIAAARVAAKEESAERL